MSAQNETPAGGTAGAQGGKGNNLTNPILAGAADAVQPWRFTSAKIDHGGQRLVYRVATGDVVRELHLYAGEAAVIGRSGPQRFDGEIREPGAAS